MKCKIIKDVSLCIRSTAVVTCEMILFRLKLHGDKKPDLSQIISVARALQSKLATSTSSLLPSSCNSRSLMNVFIYLEAPLMGGYQVPCHYLSNKVFTIVDISGLYRPLFNITQLMFPIQLFGKIQILMAFFSNLAISGPGKCKI